MKKETAKRFSVKKKMYIFVAIAILTAALGTAAIAFVTGANQIDSFYKEATADNARNIASIVDGDFLKEFREELETDGYRAALEEAEEAEDETPVREYLTEKGLWDKYDETRSAMRKYLSNMDSVTYLYIIAHGDANADHDMYLIDADPETTIFP